MKKLKSLSPILKAHTKDSVLAPTFKFLEVVFDLLVPVVVAQMIDVGVAKGDKPYIVRCFFLLLVMAAVGLTCTVTAQFFAAKASVGFAADLRKRLFDHIQSLSFSSLDTLGTDTLITRLSDDVNQVQNGLNMALRLLIRSPFIVLGSMVMAFTVNVRCALIFAVTIPILFAVILFIMSVSIPLFRKAQAGLDTVTGLTRENLTGVRVIRAFCREQQSVEEFAQSNRALTHLNEFVGRLSALLNPITYVLINLAAVALIHTSAIQVNLGHMQQGQTVALYNYMLQMIVELVKLASLIITLNKSIACGERVAAVLDEKPAMAYPASTAANDSDTNNAVVFDHVTFTYQNAGAPSLTDISFAAAKGQTIGIIGGTGSGKSTLVSLIARDYDASEGHVLVDGIDVRDYTRTDLCGKVGTVAQRARLFKGTVRENLLWGNENADDNALWKTLEIAQAKAVVEAKPGKLDFKLEQNGGNLSGGQKQRLSIARTLVKQPEILILDDSSSALDYATDAALRKAIASLSGVTTFLVYQRIAGIREADCILVLDNGHLAGSGTHEALMNDCETYREIYFSQFPEERAAFAKDTANGKERDGHEENR